MCKYCEFDFGVKCARSVNTYVVSIQNGVYVGDCASFWGFGGDGVRVAKGHT